jgi:hypothetical protein
MKPKTSFEAMEHLQLKIDELRKVLAEILLIPIDKFLKKLHIKHFF